VISEKSKGRRKRGKPDLSFELVTCAKGQSQTRHSLRNPRLPETVTENLCKSPEFLRPLPPLLVKRRALRHTNAGPDNQAVIRISIDIVSTTKASGHFDQLPPVDTLTRFLELALGGHNQALNRISSPLGNSVLAVPPLTHRHTVATSSRPVKS
jgi:hypothetical protein